MLRAQGRPEEAAEAFHKAVTGDPTQGWSGLAAARLDIPTLVVICGYQPSGHFNGKHVDIEDVFLAAGYFITGKLSLDELTTRTVDHDVGLPAEVVHRLR